MAGTNQTNTPRTVVSSPFVEPTGESLGELLNRAAQGLPQSGQSPVEQAIKNRDEAVKQNIDKITADIKDELIKQIGETWGNAFHVIWTHFAQVVYTTLQDFALAAGVASSIDEKGKQIGNVSVQPGILGIPEILELYRRGSMSQDGANLAMRPLGYPSNVADSFLEIAHPILAENQIVEGWLRGLFSEPEATAQLEKLGWLPREISTKLALATRYADLNTQIVMWWFGLITTEELHTNARTHGWPAETVDRIAEASQWIPSPVEALINARHGAFDQQAIDKWGLHDLLPEEFVPEMRKKGLHKDTALQYWAGHWSPLSNAAAVRLFQRKQMTEAETDEIFHLNGLAKGAWPLEIQAGYHVPEYFVLSAMVEASPLDIQTITRLVADMGYRPDDVPLIAAAYHAKQSASTNKKLQSQLEKAFKTGTLNRSQASEALGNIGLTATQIESVLQQVEVEVQVETMDETLKLVRHDYIEKYITEQEAVQNMLSQGFTTKQIDYFINSWKVERQLYRKRLTEAQVGKLYKDGAMDQQTAAKQWAGMGYNQTDINWLLMYYKL